MKKCFLLQILPICKWEKEPCILINRKQESRNWVLIFIPSLIFLMSLAELYNDPLKYFHLYKMSPKIFQYLKYMILWLHFDYFFDHIAVYTYWSNCYWISLNLGLMPVKKCFLLYVFELKVFTFTSINFFNPLTQNSVLGRLQSYFLSAPNPLICGLLCQPLPVRLFPEGAVDADFEAGGERRDLLLPVGFLSACSFREHHPSLVCSTWQKHFLPGAAPGLFEVFPTFKKIAALSLSETPAPSSRCPYLIGGVSAPWGPSPERYHVSWAASFPQRSEFQLLRPSSKLLNLNNANLFSCSFSSGVLVAT